MTVPTSELSLTDLLWHHKSAKKALLSLLGSGEYTKSKLEILLKLTVLAYGEDNGISRTKDEHFDLHLHR